MQALRGHASHSTIIGISRQAGKRARPTKKGDTMNKTFVQLSEIDEARITIIMDNTIDLLIASTEVARRFESPSEWYNSPLPKAEHGFSALIKVKQNENEGTVLLDTGASTDGVLHNFEALEIDASQIRAIVLSHGHFDHAMGLTGIVEKIADRNLKIVTASGRLPATEGCIPYRKRGPRFYPAWCGYSSRERRDYRKYRTYFSSG